MDLFSPVTDLRGVGPARAAALQRLGIFTLYDLLAYFPRDYEDRRALRRWSSRSRSCGASERAAT